MKLAIILAFLLCAHIPILAQEHNNENSKTHHTKEPSNLLGVFVGNTIIVQSAFKLPTFGIEYVRELNHRFGVGLTAEVEIGSHIIQQNEDGDIISEVKRQGAILFLPSVFIRVYKGLIVTIGYGIELEKNENLAMAKFGFEYRLRMHNPNWTILPSVSWDRTKLFDGIVYGVTTGYSF